MTFAHAKYKNISMDPSLAKMLVTADHYQKNVKRQKRIKILAVFFICVFSLTVFYFACDIDAESCTLSRILYSSSVRTKIILVPVIYNIDVVINDCTCR